LASKFAKTPSLPGRGIYRLGVVVVVASAVEKGDGTARREDGFVVDRCAEDEFVECCDVVDAIESVDGLGFNRVSSLFSSSSSSSSSGSNDAARSNRSFLSSRGSNDENEGGRDEIGILTGAEGDEYVLSFTVALLGYPESSSLADTWNKGQHTNVTAENLLFHSDSYR